MCILAFMSTDSCGILTDKHLPPPKIIAWIIDLIDQTRAKWAKWIF